MTEARETHTTSNVSEGHPVPSGRTECYLGIDIGSISTKGVIIDADRRIIARTYLWTEGNPADGSLQILLQTFAIMAKSINHFELREADLVVRPALSGVKSADFGARQKAIVAGRLAMQQALPQLRKLLAAPSP